MNGPRLDLSGKRVLITAGGAGIGRVMAEAFVAAGARVHVSDVSAEALASVAGVSGTLGDAGVAGDAERVVEEAARALGGLDVLVNNAGIAGPTGRVEDCDDAEVARTIEVNLVSQFLFLRRAVPLLKASPCGSVLAMSSVAGRLGYSLRTPYAATKWAIVGLVKSLAIELGPLGIRANAILPGLVKGPRIERVIAGRAEAAGVSYAEMEAEYRAKVSLRRMVEAEDVANMALFLASDLAKNISGQAISVDGNVEYL